MLLGVFVHTAIVLPLFYKDLNVFDQNLLNVFYQTIHIFRMPTFFFLAGIFASALLVKSGYLGFLTSRFKRVVSVLILAEGIIAATLLPQGCNACSVIGSTSYLDNGWLHLWFLFYLALISHAWLLVTFCWQKLNNDSYQTFTATLGKFNWFNPITFALLGSLTFLIPNYLGKDRSLKMTFALMPDLSLLTVFGLFYLVGWLAFFNIHSFQQKLANNVWWNLGLGAIAGIGSLYVMHGYFYTLSMWWLTVGIVGIFVRYAPIQNRFFEYFTRASYWIYLWHPIFVLVFAYVFVLLGLPLWFNFLMTSLLSLFIVSVSYTWLVKDSIVDKWLSGRRRRELGLTKKTKHLVMQETISS